MESVEASRQSGLSSILNLDHREKIERINTDHHHSSTSTMAAALISPSTYSNHPPPPYPGRWAPGSTNSGLVSPPDSRRTSGNEKSIPPPIQTSTPHRPSLPSIHELTGPNPGPYGSPVSASLPQSARSVTYSQPPLSASRAYPPEQASYPAQVSPTQRPPSPSSQTYPQSNPFVRSEERAGAFPEAQRHSSVTSVQAASGSHNPYPASQYEAGRYEHDPRSREVAPSGYHHPPPPPQQLSQQQQQPAYHYGPSHQQMPLTQQAPIYTQPRYQPRDAREMTESWKLSRDGEKQDPSAAARQGVKRHLDVWDFENNLAEINTSSNALQEWSSHYNAIAQEQQRSVNTLPARMPTMDSVEEMMKHQLKICSALQRMQSIIHEQASIDQRLREQGNRQGEYDDDMSIYGEDAKSHGYSSEGKKRRGRAAPPGRCHSCNRAETPEWRRGPDGARTLCNACGLHYAKLTRKNTMKQSQGSNGSNLRPKSMDGVSPRPM